MKLRPYRPLAVTALLLGSLALSACGGNKEDAKSPSDAPAGAVDSDPIALLPSAPIALVRIDVRAMVAAGRSGAELTKLSDRFFPLGDEAGFRASRDLETVYVGSYSFSGVDVLTVVRGTFDQAKIKTVAEQHTPVKAGGVLVASDYAKHVVYTVNNVGFTLLSDHTALVGNETGIRRGLDRLRDGTPARTVPAWMIETLETKDAAIAVAADFETQDVAKAVGRTFPMPWLTGLRAVRALGDFKSPGFNVAATASYREEAQADAGVEGVKKMAGLLTLLSLGAPIPKLQKLEVTREKSDTHIKFGADDKELAELLRQAPKLLGGE